MRKAPGTSMAKPGHVRVFDLPIGQVRPSVVSGDMVYWRCEDLMAASKPIATYEKVCTVVET